MSEGVGVVETKKMKLELPEGGFRFASGGVLKEIEVAYEECGAPLDGRNAIFICHALTGDAHVAGIRPGEEKPSGWWEGMVGPGRAFDTNRFHIICANVIGGCSGTTGPMSINPETGRPYGSAFPQYNFSEAVDVYRMLVRQLGVKKLYAVVGGSYGGMMVTDWMTRCPEDMDRVCLIATSAELNTQAIAFSVMSRTSITDVPQWNGGDYYEGEVEKVERVEGVEKVRGDEGVGEGVGVGGQRADGDSAVRYSPRCGQGPRAGLAAARQLAHVTYLSRELLQEKFQRRLQDNFVNAPEKDRKERDRLFKTYFQIESYLDYQALKFVRRFDANSYLHITRSMDLFSAADRYGGMDEAFARVQAKVLVVSYAGDILFPDWQSKEIVASLLRNGKNVSYCHLEAGTGHDSFLTDISDLSGLISGFLLPREPKVMKWQERRYRNVVKMVREGELRARGEDIGELLTALKFKLADPEQQRRATYRFQSVRNEVWGRTLYGRQSDWCRRHGVYSSGHFLEHEGCYYDLGLAAGDVMTLLKYVEVPGVDLVCCQYYPNQREKRGHQVAYGQMPKYASSAAHVYNRHNGLNWCEIFGAYYQRITYPQMKWMMDWHQSQGCYYLIPHSFNPAAPFDTDCPPYFYNGGKEPRYPLFRVWADYNNRCAMLLSGGEHVCRIAQCLPGISYHVGKTVRPEMLAFAIQDAQLDSDWLNYDAVETARIVRNPRTGRPALRTENGKEHYDVLTLPATEYVPFAVLEKALAFAKEGGVVVGYAVRPCNTPTRGKTAADAQAIVDRIFAQPTALFIEGEPDGAALRKALAGNYPGTAEPLARRDIDFVGLSADDGRMLAVYQYEKDGDRVFFIANQDFARGRELTVRAAWPAEAAELWDPMQGTAEKPAVADGCVKVSLAPSGAAFLAWPKKPTAGLLPRVERPEGAALAATVTEKVTPVTIDAGADNVYDKAFKGAKWIWHPADREAAGKVTFRTSFDAPAAGEATLVFVCDNAAEVRVNGKTAGTQAAGHAPDYSGWRTPTHAQVALKAGRNEVEVVGENSIKGFAGLLVSFQLADGRRVCTDANWEASRDGGGFVKAAEICAYGGAPWGAFGHRGVTKSPVAESVETALAFDCPELAAGERLYLVCDDVEGEHSAAVTVNGRHVGGFIGQPYRLDVTRAAKPGANALAIRPFRVKNPRLVVVR